MTRAGRNNDESAEQQFVELMQSPEELCYWATRDKKDYRPDFAIELLTSIATIICEGWPAEPTMLDASQRYERIRQIFETSARDVIAHNAKE